MTDSTTTPSANHGADKLRILIADDHPLFRDGLRALLTSLPDFEVVGEAEDGAQAMAQALALQPDLIFMDLRMPGVDGVQAIREITRASPHIGLIVVTMLNHDSAVFSAFKAGARGYLLKDARQEEIVHAIRTVASGGAMLGAALAKKVQVYFHALAPKRDLLVFPELTDREREVLQLVAQGLSNTQITERLNVSPRTVRNHITNIFAKLQVATRSEAIVHAREAGL